MPMKVTSVADAGEVHPNPFLGPVDHTQTVRVDVSGLTTDEVDTYGYIKPGVMLTRSGKLVGQESFVSAIGTLQIDATPEDFKTTTTMVYTIAGAQYTKAATGTISFSAAHVVALDKFGVILLQVNAAGTVSTKVPDELAAATTPMTYATAALALAQLPAADADNVAFAYIAIEADSGAWTANTDDMTDAGDLETATFNDVDLTYEETNPFRGFGIVVEAVKIAGGSTDALLAAATDIDIAVATICQINRDIVEDSLGRALTTAEMTNKSDSIVITST